jgi:hypothetical protein
VADLGTGVRARNVDRHFKRVTSGADNQVFAAPLGDLGYGTAKGGGE